MLNRESIALGRALLLVLAWALPQSAHGQTEKPKYYFKITDVECEDKKVIPMVVELLEKEVATRPEFTTEIGTAQSEAAQIAEMRKQGMLGYQVSIRVLRLNKEIRAAAPGKRDQQMSVDVKLSIFGHTIPGNKVMFTGDGEASLQGDFSERLKEKEEDRFVRAALAGALKQAVSTAATKLANASLAGDKTSKRKMGKTRR